MLQINQIDVGYGDVQVLKEVSMDVRAGELVVVIGANGAGKTTMLKAISGLLKASHGSISFDGHMISKQSPDRIVAEGITLVPEGRLLFPEMTVYENLEMGAYQLRDHKIFAERLKTVFELFPRLKERQGQLAGTFSGGEQQMLAIGRGLMASPKMIMLDEPSLGLAPKLVQQIFDMVLQINRELGVTVLLVEQNVRLSCEIAHRAFVMENGRVVLSGTGEAMLENEHVRKAYLGL
jgi:branched-chain amino acid transport system ATP-binding protein